MKNLKLMVAATALIMLSTSCNVYNYVTVNEDLETDFTVYKTFAWLKDITDTTNSPYNNEVIRNNIRNYLGKSFAERGFALGLDTPDVLLQVAIHNNKVVQEILFMPRTYYYSKYYFRSDYYSPYPYNYYYTQNNIYCYPMGYCTQQIEYMEGSITLNVIDRKQNKMVWTGTVKGNVYDPAFIDRNIHPAVMSIMKKYPVKPFPSHKRAKTRKTVREKIVSH